MKGRLFLALVVWFVACRVAMPQDIQAVSTPSGLPLRTPPCEDVGMCGCEDFTSSHSQIPKSTNSRFEFSGGLLWTGRSSLGSSAATLTPNQAGAASPYTLFSTSAELGATKGVTARVAVNLSNAIAVEARGGYSNLELALAIRGDAESAPDRVSTGERLSEYTVEGAVVVSFNRWRFGRRAVPFVSAGAGYLRQLHEGDVLAETGRVYHVGGGAKLQLVSRPDRRVRAIGVHGQLNASVRDGGVTFSRRRQMFPTAQVSLYLGI